MKRLFISTIISAASILAMAQTQSVTHVVQRGETIESIAEYYHVSVADINKANPNAEGVVYVGMKLAVPTKGNLGNVSYTHESSREEATETYKNARKDIGGMNTTNGTHSTWKRNECRIFWGVTYFAQDFSDVKLSGHYGITIDALNIGDSLFGFNITLSSFNWGLVDKDYTTDLILFGPNISYEIIPNLSFALPLQAMCNASFEGTDTKTSWGWAVSPRMYYWVGKKVNINAGVLVNGGFEKGSGVNCGFTVGLGFNI